MQGKRPSRPLFNLRQRRKDWDAEEGAAESAVGLNRICAHCGKDLGGVGGYMLARDVLVVLKGDKPLPREFCDVCMVNNHPDVLAHPARAEG